MFAPIYKRTAGVDGWVSLEVSPLLAHDTAKTVAEARALHAKANRSNLFIKIPGTLEGLPAIEEAIFSGMPVNVTLLFSRDDYVRAADAYMRGLERRVAAGLDPDVRSVASVFVSRWDKATLDKVPAELSDRLGIAVSQQSYKAYRDLLEFGSLAAAGRLGRPATAAVVRQHQHQGSAGVGRALCRRARRAEHDQHHAGGDVAGVRRAWRGRSGDAARRRRCRAGAGRDHPGRGRCWRRWPGSCKMKAQRVSSIPGRICSVPSRRRARH